MKYFGLLFVIISVFSPVFAQTGSGSGYSITDQLDMGKVYGNMINKVNLKFCNDGIDNLSNSLDLVMRPNQKKQVCIALINQSNETLEIISKVVPGSLDRLQNVVCSNKGELSGDILVDEFGQFESPIVMKPNENIVKYFTLSSSEISSGKYYSCFGVNLSVSEKMGPNSPFELVIRKAGNIKVTVIGETYKLQWFDDIIGDIKANIRQIAIAGIIVCGILMVYYMIPSRKNKSNLHKKKASHKK